MYVQGKVALITGSASGIGLASAKELLKNGLKGVTITDVDVIKGEEAVEDLQKTFGKDKAIFVKVDVSKKNEIEDAMKKTVETFGNFDILVNNAGIMNDSIWEKEIDINIKGVMYGCLLALEEYLPKYKTGSSEPTIVNIASETCYIPLYFAPVYCGTKAAILAISRSLATQENYDSQRVRVVALCPGATATNLFVQLETISFTPRHTERLKKLIKDPRVLENIQKPEVVGEALVMLLENGVNGSSWIIDKNKFFEYKIPIPSPID